ncbi:MAG: high-potential iron-sulfur protein [Formivibrio sp.]|nr:high-potential iron-sulfur protein [Formivibrio sp.]
MKTNPIPRRLFLKIGAAALASIPVVVVSGRAEAATNVAMRSALKYQIKPQGDKSCSTCLQFIPGASANKLGACKLFPGDTEVSPQGYCLAWAKKA